MGGAKKRWTRPVLGVRSGPEGPCLWHTDSQPPPKGSYSSRALEGGAESPYVTGRGLQDRTGPPKPASLHPSLPPPIWLPPILARRGDFADVAKRSH